MKGSIIVADGTGKVTYIEPAQADMVVTSDPSDPKGVKFVDRSMISGETISKSTAVDNSYVTAPSYTTIMYPSVPGESTKKIKSIKVNTFQTSNIDSHQIRIYDQTNNNIVAETTFTNDKIAINDMGTLANLPNTETILEIQAQRNGGNKNAKVSRTIIKILW